MGQPLLEVLAFLSETGEDWSIRESMCGQTCRTAEQPFFLPETGREGWYEAQYTPLRRASGEIVGVLCILRDITEAKKKLEAAQAPSSRPVAPALQPRVTPPAVEPKLTPSAQPRVLPSAPKRTPGAPGPKTARPAPVAPPASPVLPPSSLLPPALRGRPPGVAMPPHPLVAPPAPAPPEPVAPDPVAQDPEVETPSEAALPTVSPSIAAGPSEFGGDAPIFDREAALGYVGDAAVLEELIQGFIVSLPEFVREMDHAVGRRDITAVIDHAADVKKAVVTLGGVRAIRIADRLESMTPEAKFEDVERTWWRLRRELAVFRETLRTSRKAA
jgi:PAS domain-containing protein